MENRFSFCVMFGNEIPFSKVQWWDAEVHIYSVVCILKSWEELMSAFKICFTALQML